MDINLTFLQLFLSQCILLPVIVQTVENADYNTVPKADPTLKYVMGVFRHGIRSPLYFPFKTDPYKPDSKYFPEGKGRLTKAGKQLMYNVGKALRARYGAFLNDDGIYDGSKIRFSSTSGKRNRLSAILVTEGMYSGDREMHDFSVWNVRFKRRSNAFINYTTTHFDTSYLVSKFPLKVVECKYFSNQFMFNVINNLILPQTPENIKLYKFLGEKTGTNFKSVVSFLNIWDRLECQRMNGLKLPEWSKGIYPDKMRPLFVSFVKETLAGTELMNNIASAPFFRELHRLFKVALDPDLDEKAYFHATHENGIYQLLFKMEITKPLKIEVGDVVMFELHEEGDKHFVKMYHLLSLENVLSQIEVPGCEEKCPLDKFIELTPEMSTKDWKWYCKTESTSFLTFWQSVRYIYNFLKELITWFF